MGSYAASGHAPEDYDHSAIMQNEGELAYLTNLGGLSSRLVHQFHSKVFYLETPITLSIFENTELIIDRPRSRLVWNLADVSPYRTIITDCVFGVYRKMRVLTIWHSDSTNIMIRGDVPNFMAISEKLEAYVREAKRARMREDKDSVFELQVADEAENLVAAGDLLKQSQPSGNSLAVVTKVTGHTLQESPEVDDGVVVWEEVEPRPQGGEWRRKLVAYNDAYFIDRSADRGSRGMVEELSMVKEELESEAEEEESRLESIISVDIHSSTSKQLAGNKFDQMRAENLNKQTPLIDDCDPDDGVKVLPACGIMPYIAKSVSDVGSGRIVETVSEIQVVKSKVKRTENGMTSYVRRNPRQSTRASSDTQQAAQSGPNSGGWIRQQFRSLLRKLGPNFHQRSHKD